MQTLSPQEVEAARIAALRACGLLDTGADPSFDAFVKIAAHVCETPIALVSLVDATRVYFKAGIGVSAPEVPRDDGFCTHGITSRDLIEVSDTTLDPRFADNRFVVGKPYLRFYAGVPLVDGDGHALGMLCVQDYRPRTLTEMQRDSLRRLAESLESLIEARKNVPGEYLRQLALLGDALEFVASPIVLTTVRSGSQPTTISFVNRAFAGLFGYAPTDLIGRRLGMLAGALTDVGTFERLRAAALDGKPGVEKIVLYTASGTPKLVHFLERPVNASHRIVNLIDLTDIQSAHDSLERSNERLRSLLANDTEAVLTIDTHGRCLDVNATGEALFGHERAAFLLDPLTALGVDRFFPRGETFPRELLEGRTMEFAASFRRGDGRELSLACRAVPMIVSGTTVGAYVIAKDVTEADRLARRVAEQSQRTHALYLISANNVADDAKRIDAALELVLDTFDMQYGFLARIEGEMVDVQNVVGDGLTERGRLLPLEKTRLREVMRLADVFSVDDMSSPEGRLEGIADYPGWHAYVSAPLVIGGAIWGAIGFSSTNVRAFDDFDRDFVRLAAVLVSSALERGMQNKRLDDLAHLDALTGLPNRAKFMTEIEAAIVAAGEADRQLALHFVDLDGFKNVNDRAGHAMGDLALTEVAARLRRIAPSGHLRARLGGDEFVILQTDIRSDADVDALATSVVDDLARPYELEAQAFAMGASVGVAIFPRDGATASELLRAADAALYRAKARGKCRVEMA